MDKYLVARSLTRAASAAVGAALLLAAAGCGPKPAPPPAATPPPAGQVDEHRLLTADSAPGSWLSMGRDYGRTHYSPLDGINRDNVARLGFAWEMKTGTNRGMQATPLVIDGVMYTSGVAGRVYALDAASGAPKWQFEPPLKLRNARGSCCDI